MSAYNGHQRLEEIESEDLENPPNQENPEGDEDDQGDEEDQQGMDDREDPQGGAGRRGGKGLRGNNGRRGGYGGRGGEGLRGNNGRRGGYGGRGGEGLRGNNGRRGGEGEEGGGSMLRDVARVGLGDRIWDMKWAAPLISAFAIVAGILAIFAGLIIESEAGNELKKNIAFGVGGAAISTGAASSLYALIEEDTEKKTTRLAF